VKNSKKAVAKFFTQLQALTEKFNSLVSTNDGDWIVKGFIDVFKNVYTISGDTKVIIWRPIWNTKSYEPKADDESLTFPNRSRWSSTD
jgi:hypothetical protein